MTETKIKLNLPLPSDHPLCHCIATLKERGLKPKDIDAGAIVAAALDTVDKDFWTEQLNQLTPLQWRVQRALSDPTGRSRIESALDGLAIGMSDKTAAPADPDSFFDSGVKLTALS